MFASNTSQVSGDAVFVEDVYSTFLYQGNGSTQTITNGVDLSTYGGLVWIKERVNASNHVLLDTLRGGDQRLQSNTTAAQATIANAITSFNSNGFTLGASGAVNAVDNYASWTFRKQPKFFDVVTYTGNGVARTITHSLGSVPGCIIVKSLNAADDWAVYHRSAHATNPQNYTYYLNQTLGRQADSSWNGTQPTSTVFSVSGSGYKTNESGVTYVAYLFAHNAGGFGLTGADNVISCGSFTTNGSGAASVTLGYEPQFVMFKSSAGSTTNWTMLDSMRGWTNNSAGFDPDLSANLSAAESDAGSGNDLGYPTATGFTISNQSVGVTFIYIAIRRGPMKTPTSGTSVFMPVASSASAGTVLTTGFPVDLQITGFRPTTGAHWVMDRLRGVSTNSTPVGSALRTTGTDAETSPAGTYTQGWNNTGFQMTTTFESVSDIFWNFRRAPGFFDEVCTTANGSANQRVAHNLGVAPELIITKVRTGLSQEWRCYSATLGRNYYIVLNTSDPAIADTNAWGTANPTATDFGVRSGVWDSGYNYVSYLFASCSGVSKVGSYTGTGTTQQINCGFTAGARFVLIKRTDSTGNWGVLDTARGMVSGTDPYLNLNTTAAEVNANNVYTATGGFQLVSSDANFNASGGSYIFLAVA